MRKFFLVDPTNLENGGWWVNVKRDTDCVFCQHCKDLYWDYTNGIYALICGEGHDCAELHCKYFVESEESEEWHEN